VAALLLHWLWQQRRQAMAAIMESGGEQWGFYMTIKLLGVGWWSLVNMVAGSGMEKES